MYFFFLTFIENFLTFGLCFYLLCQAELTTLLFTSDQMVPYFFLPKDGKDAVQEWRKGRRGAFLPPVSALSLYI